MTAAPVGRRPGNADSSSSTADRFSLTGPSRPLDPRIEAYRHDLADIALAGRIIAPHFARPLLRGCGAHPTFVRSGPDALAEPVSQLLPGEDFAVLEYACGWAWGYCAADHIVGYVEAIELADRARPSHIVCEKCAPVAADDRITSPVLATLPMGSRLCGQEQGACLATEYGCVSLSHLRRLDEHDEDPVVVAERLIGAPYLAGGRSFGGIDSSGLVQLALGLCGLAAPRLAEQQRRLGEPLPQGAPARRGDLVLFDDEAGLMVDDLLIIHASRAAGKVTVDPVAILGPAGMERRRLPV
ncbi:MAG TPA: NlpC/P60 family protein [Allosphingosinicella sp.]|nr:NlpC/P60 family protein [Allosphingosinicella sp.]